MTANGWFSALLATAFIGFFAARLLVKPVLAFTSTPKDDLSRIRAELEGLQGEAGPSMKVVHIARSGGTLPTRSHDAERSYLVTLQRPDGSTEQRTVRIEVAFLGEGRMSLDHEPRSSSAPDTSVSGPTSAPHLRDPAYPDWWVGVPPVVRFVLAAGAVCIVLVGVEVVPALPFISEAKEQLSYVLRVNDINVVQLYSRGHQCGVYTAGHDARPMWFLIDNQQVWTGPEPSGGPRADAPYDSSEPYDRWSRCVTDNKGTRSDDGFALSVLHLFH